MKTKGQKEEFDLNGSSTCTCTFHRNMMDELPERGRIQHEMRDTGLCADCQQKAQPLPILCSLCGWNGHCRNYEVYPVHCHQRWTCNCCNKPLFPSCISQESIIPRNSNGMKILLRLSARPCPYVSKNTNAFCQTINLNKKVNTIMRSTTTINEKLKHVNDGLIVQQNTLQCLNQECLLLKMSCEQTNACITKMKSDQDECEKKLQQITQLLEDLHYISYDGTFIWKITNVDQKIAEAQFGKQTSIESPVLYSSPYGYKMRARLFLNGDGDGEDTHMSIFFVLFKGDYDAILSWPFTIPVVFCLFDQTGQNRHIIDRFYPDTKSSSFQRPTSEKNIASGIPKFCPLAVIKKQENYYVRDNTMFIKTMLDFGETPREVLPYTLSVNPGLPTSMQEAIRRMELEKHKQAREALRAEMIRNDQEISRRGLIPMDRSVLPETTQQQSTSRANFQDSASCEDILHE